MNTKQCGVTVWTDEHGVTREYREVKRKAQVGELVKIVGGFGHGFNSGEIASVTYEFGHDLVRAKTNLLTQTISHIDGDYVVLEPTDIIHYGGKRWREVKRTPVAGDLIIAAEGHAGFDIGDVFVVYDNGLGLRFVDKDGDVRNGGAFIHFNVLEPVTDDEKATPPADERIQALERRLHAAEAEIKALTERVAALEGGKLTDAVKRGRELIEAAKKRTYTREQVVEMAKKDVEELIRIGKTAKETLRGAREPFEYYFFHVKFVENRNKRTVVALVYEAYYNGRYDKKTPPARGIAKCAPDDCFNIHIGRAIALRRALGLDVPDYYVNAPQPTEAQVGDVIRFNDDEDDYVVVDWLDKNTPFLYATNVKGPVNGRFIVVDDSHDFGGSQPQPNAKGRAAA